MIVWVVPWFMIGLINNQPCAKGFETKSILLNDLLSDIFKDIGYTKL